MQEYKHELKVMDEDEDEDDEAMMEDIAKNLHLSLDEELLGSAGNEEKNTSSIHNNHNTSIASFVNDLIRENSPNPPLPDSVASILSPSKYSH